MARAVPTYLPPCAMPKWISLTSATPFIIYNLLSMTRFEIKRFGTRMEIGMDRLPGQSTSRHRGCQEGSEKVGAGRPRRVSPRAVGDTSGVGPDRRVRSRVDRNVEGGVAHDHRESGGVVVRAVACLPWPTRYLP